MLHKFHPHSRKIHAFLSVFLAFHGKIASFLIYYKMKTTFTFENFLSCALWCCKAKRRSPVTFTGKRLCFAIRILFLSKNTRCQNETSFSRNSSQFLHICTKTGRFFRNKILLSPSCPMPLCKGSKLAQYSIRETFFIRLASSCAVLFASKVVEKL